MNMELRNECLNCPHRPCQNEGCPLDNHIPEFIHAKTYEEAYEILCRTTVLPAICGRICPHSKQCQGKCTKNYIGAPVQIGKIEAEIADYAYENDYKIPKEIDDELTEKKVAIIGSGPAGLTCAAFLARKGVKVTIYEKYKELGGILVHEIPEFRLNKGITKNTIEKILELGMEVEYEKELGKNIFIDDLIKKYDKIFVAIGANEPNFKMDGNNIYSANKMLENSDFPDFKNKKVIVNGGGNVAIDIARTAKRKGADVTIVYRRGEEQMPAELKEIQDAKDDKVEFKFKTNILGFSKNKLECIETELIKTDKEERPVPQNIEGSNFEMDCDMLIMATGSVPEKLATQGFITDDKGYIKVDTKYRTSIENVYAGGDIINSNRTIATAARTGRDVANEIINNFKH